MAVTIYDVAKRAGVGIGTVSRAINNSSHITEETKVRVMNTIKALDYQPHAVAQSLARKKTNTIACIIPFFTGYFFMEMLQGIQHKVTEYKYDLILYSVDMPEQKETFLQRVLEERRVDGLLLVSLDITKARAEKFRQSNFPIVLVDSNYPELDAISVENLEGAYLATKHLIDLGYAKIGMIGGQLKSFPAKERLDGFKKALHENNLPFDEHYFVACDFADEADGFNKEAGYTAMKRLLGLGADRPRAVFVSSDIQAIGAMQATREQGLRIPQDVAVVGFDDIELAQYVGLTTMRQPISEMGELAVERLMNNIKDLPKNGFKQHFQTQLVVRESCGGLGRS